MGLFGLSKIAIMLEKYSFNPGDIAKGKITLNLKKPAYARKLEIHLIGIRKVRKGNTQNWEKVYDFELQIPDARNQQQAIQESLDNKLGSAGKLISAFTLGTGATSWKIRA